jgi:nicotinamidase-related amidase
MISETRHSQSRIHRARAALAVVDIQEKLLPAMFEKERVLRNTLRLLLGAAELNVPVIVTEQYRKGLGATVPELAAAAGGFAPLEKMAFSACGAKGFVEALAAREVSDVVLCGIEAHVCVCQTGLDLLERDYRLFVVADAVSSRSTEDKQLGLRRLEQAGAVIVSTEMVLFELLEKAGTEEFKKIHRIIK